MTPFLISLSENDKRIILAICLILILVFVIVGYIGLLVERIMKKQAKTASKMLNNVVQAKVIINEKDFVKFGRKKNNQLFAKQARIPLCILLVALFTYIIFSSVTHIWNLNIFDHEKYGFSTLLFLWDFPNAPHVIFFGMRIISGWPPLLNTPHFEVMAIASYIIVPCIFVGGIWLLVDVQAHIARAFRIKKLGKDIFNPSLDALANQIQNPIQNNNSNSTNA